MPIRPENRGRYPADWDAISLRIRFERAEGQCECVGECGLTHEGGRCDARHGHRHPRTGAKAVRLTTAHRHGSRLEDATDEELFAACEQCHNRYDAPMRAAGVKARKEAERLRVLEKAGQLAFEIECATGRRIAR